MNNSITVETVVHAPIEKVWEFWNGLEHIGGWAFASDDWEARATVNDVRVGGRFSTTMSAKDKSASFEFAGIYTAVEVGHRLAYDMEDGRHVMTEFFETPEGVRIVESFDPEQENSEELQRSGWQAILDNFARYVQRAL